MEKFVSRCLAAKLFLLFFLSVAAAAPVSSADDRITLPNGTKIKPGEGRNINPTVLKLNALSQKSAPEIKSDAQPEQLPPADNFTPPTYIQDILVKRYGPINAGEWRKYYKLWEKQLGRDDARWQMAVDQKLFHVSMAQRQTRREYSRPAPAIVYDAPYTLWTSQGAGDYGTDYLNDPYFWADMRVSRAGDSAGVASLKNGLRLLRQNTNYSALASHASVSRTTPGTNVHVDAYTKKDGTRVEAHTRSWPGTKTTVQRK